MAAISDFQCLKKPCGGSFSTVYTGVLASGDKTNIGVKKLDKVVQVVETSDLGLAKLLMINQTQTLTGMRETKGYLPPEWFRNMPVTVKDVIAKGYWKSWCRMMKRQGSDPKTLEKPVMIAIQFVKEKPPLRPSLRIVALMLQSILEVPSPPCSFAFAVRCFKSYPFSVTLDQNWQFCYITGKYELLHQSCQQQIKKLASQRQSKSYALKQFGSKMQAEDLGETFL
ncbi:hypothetical protein WN944_020731 [Citrus x changshan-huyou]|uniref:Uncharacterized protein n=1 Tax=Citrus x changshan-huyou TaxID=2935761 RepID=A0AAP0M0V0_9ROSI